MITVTNRTFSAITLSWVLESGKEKKLEFPCIRKHSETQKTHYIPVQVDESELDDFLSKKPEFKAYFEPQDGNPPMLDAPGYKIKVAKKAA